MDNDNLITCPKCSAKSNNPKECSKCGVVFEKHNLAKEISFNNAKEAFISGRMEEALQIFTEFMRRYPGDEETSKSYIKKIKEKILDDKRKNLRNRYLDKAYEALQENKFDEAKEWFTEIAGNYPELADKASDFLKIIEARKKADEEKKIAEEFKKKLGSYTREYSKKKIGPHIGKCEQCGLTDKLLNQDEFGKNLCSKCLQLELDNKDTTPKLIQCPDCGKDVSKRATICPNCGCPITQVETSYQSTYSGPECPHCGSTNYHKISFGNKAGAGLLFGPFAIGHIAKTFKCDQCGYKW
jgi:tetratricopeptide (TPR) repeat protein